VPKGWKRAAAWAVGVAVLAGAPAWPSALKPDEELVLFPTWARSVEGGAAGGEREVPLHGWVYEPEEDSALRAGALGLFRAWFGGEWSEAEGTLFRERARLFLVDNERGKRVLVRVAGREVVLGPSGADGHLEGALRLGAVELGGGPLPRWLPVAAVLPGGDPRQFAGSMLLLAETGLSVISDLDDTIKDSHVTDRRELLANTFLRPFRAVPGMAEAYRRWEAAGATFHYVSASPWQLYGPLSRFLAEAGFPAGTWHMKRVRLVDTSAANLFASPLESKGPAIRALLEAFPARRFALVGDSGESDPELYAGFAREFPGRVERVLIRDVTGEGRDSDRMTAAFLGVSPEVWTVFTDPASLAWAAKGRIR